MTASLLKHPLLSHPANPPLPGLRAEVQQLAADDPARPLRLRFVLAGALESVRWPGPLGADRSARVDGLWRHTCFEAFVAAPTAPGAARQVVPAMRDRDPAARATPAAAVDATPYVEFNCAPSGAWAIYRFDGYRAGMRPEPVTVEPRIRTEHAPGCLAVEVALAWPVPLPGASVGAQPGRQAAPWRGRLGLSAVVEATDGSLSYWALHHPAPRADFHNGRGFSLGIEVPA